MNSPGRQEQKDVTHAAYVFQEDQWNCEERLWNFVYVVFGICLGVQKASILMRKNAFGYLFLPSEYFQQLQKPTFCRKKGLGYYFFALC